MWINMAYAATEVASATPEAPSAMEALMLNLLLVLIFVALFYVLFIMPQQKRFKQHRTMMDGLKKGDRVLTMAGFVATIEKIEEGNNEVVLKLDDKVKVTAMRSAIQNRMDPAPKPANDAKSSSKSKASKKDAKSSK